jgi:hypothetical protein
MSPHPVLRRGMGRRSALLINCSVEESREIHERAAREHRTISAHVLVVVMRIVGSDERLFERLQKLTKLSLERGKGERTTLLLRCTAEEAGRIRLAARRRDTTISGFVLGTLHRWRDLVDTFNPPHQTAMEGVLTPVQKV